MSVPKVSVFERVDCILFFFFQETLWYSVDKVSASAKILESASRKVLEASFIMLENEIHQIEKDASAARETSMRMKLM